MSAIEQWAESITVEQLDDDPIRVFPAREAAGRIEADLPMLPG